MRCWSRAKLEEMAAQIGATLNFREISEIDDDAYNALGDWLFQRRTQKIAIRFAIGSRRRPGYFACRRSDDERIHALVTRPWTASRSSNRK